MKHETYAEYDSRRSEMAQSAFLSIWSSFTRWHQDLVLLGGLVPRYICKPPKRQSLPPPATIDVDLGIALGTESGQYDPISTALAGQGFNRHPTMLHRFEKEVDVDGVRIIIPLDFLVESNEGNMGTVAVDNITATVMPGVNRALATAREVEIQGKDLQGAEQKVVARVCEIGPFLALKLRAFLDRQQGKDVFDILYTVQNYDGGPDAALKGFAEELRAKNRACIDAMKCLETMFKDEQAPGPVRASHFLLGQREPDEHSDISFRRSQIRQQMVDVAAALRK
ncbi:MAG: nucleotidyl transferase AbiEii/AbiGii toxin family protein [Verrucomicrobia bacterium]|nr:nucleotidyl transferase AbiEii/AbiGii toxin family protein [Verrucomicrobiota bacterium]MCH8513528.1 nucleotidyl transferase AbiEii/AbiGii toxin family protein [Kiritimatiellia bacterium]